MTALCQKSGAELGKYPVGQQLYQKARKRPQRARFELALGLFIDWVVFSCFLPCLLSLLFAVFWMNLPSCMPVTASWTIQASILPVAAFSNFSLPFRMVYAVLRKSNLWFLLGICSIVELQPSILHDFRTFVKCRTFFDDI